MVSVFLSHAHDELFYLLGHTGAATRATLLAPVKLLRDQSCVPAQQGVGCGQGRERLEALATERVGQCGKAAALGISQAEPPTAEMGFERAVFLLEVGDRLWLVPLEPPGDHGDQEMKKYRHSSG
jgi:hypothetical protein